VFSHFSVYLGRRRLFVGRSRVGPARPLLSPPLPARLFFEETIEEVRFSLRGFMCSGRPFFINPSSTTSVALPKAFSGYSTLGGAPSQNFALGGAFASAFSLSPSLSSSWPSRDEYIQCQRGFDGVPAFPICKRSTDSFFPFPFPFPHVS